jgi:hypothetical protein
MIKNDICFFQKGMIEIVEGKGRPSFPFHSHKSFLVGVIKSGKAILKFKENEYEVHDGMTYIVPSSTGFSLTPVTAYSYLTICIAESLKDVLMHYISTNTIRFNIGEDICSICQSYKLGMNADDFFYKLSNILGLENIDNMEILEESGENDFITEAVIYINEHISEKITLDDIAKNVHVSKYHLLREFQKRMSVTPKQYIFQGKIKWTLLSRQIF